MFVALFAGCALPLPVLMVRWAVVAGRAAREAEGAARDSAVFAARAAAGRRAVEAIRGEVA